MPLMTTTAFPPGLEHLNPKVLPAGYTDHGEFAEWTDGITKSPNDGSDYRLIRLKNGMECALVHDPAAQKCAASMAVRVGHLDDPVELPGLAHFLEHLLFMGSAKFPGENEYSDHLSKHSGVYNAYTSTDATVYFFETTPAGFAGALDRFSQFFVAPLFNENCVEREIKAVDSEHQKNLQNDFRRMYQLEKSLAKEDHVYHKFGTGNLDTLWHKPRAAGIDIRSELIKFYEQHYSSNLMKLVLVSNQPLEEMTAHVLQHFAGVPNRNAFPVTYPGDPYGPSMVMTRLAIKTITDYSSVAIQFPFYNFPDKVGVRPAEVVCYLLDNRGPTSLFTFLKNKGLAVGLEAHPYNAAPGIDFFEIEVELTKEGLKRHQLVVAAVFEYLDLMRNSTFPSWAFDEYKQILERMFRFKESSAPHKTAVSLSNVLQNPWPRSQMLSGPYAATEADASTVAHALSYLRKDRARIKVCSQTPLEGLTYDQREFWYGTEYAKPQPLQKEWFENQLADDDILELPGQNRFLTSNYDLVGPRKSSDYLPRPLCIKRSIGQTIWWKLDDRWKVPKASVFFKFTNPSLQSSSRARLLGDCFVYLVDDSLEKYAYDAGNAGLLYNFSKSGQALELTVSGYTDKLVDYLTLILQHIKACDFSEDSFESMREEKLKNLDNQVHKPPLDQCSAVMSWMTGLGSISHQETRSIIRNITLSEIKEFASKILSKFYMEVLAHGNLDKFAVYEMASVVEEVLGHERLSRSVLALGKGKVVPRESNFVVPVKASGQEEVNNGIAYFLLCEHPDDEKSFIHLLLLAALMREPCFDTLRTKEQLGYIVGAGLRFAASQVGLRIVIQSARSPIHLEQRIEAFLEAFSRDLAELEQAKFEAIKNAMLADLSEDHKKQSDESNSYWAAIDNGLYDFFRENRLAALTKEATLEGVQKLFAEYISPSNKARSKLSIHLYSQRCRSTDFDGLTTALKEHKVDIKFLEDLIKDSPLPKTVREVVEKHLKESHADLHACCKEDILRAVDRLAELPHITKELPSTQVNRASELKEIFQVGEPRKQVGDFYDGLARL